MTTLQTGNPYVRLMRLHQTAGIWLLMWPCWWAVAMASPGSASLSILFLFFLGAVLMRPAGCIINDMADRTFDRQVERTKSRPLASGELSMKQAGMLLSVLLLLSLCVAWALGPRVLVGAAASLVLVAIYPFMKRITWWPQLFLGLAFNWGALLGWIAIRGTVEWPAVMLYVGGIFWTLGYDTIYAHQDKRDDAAIGVKSTALRLGETTRAWLLWFYGAAITCFSVAGILAEQGVVYYLGMVLLATHFLWQITRVDLEDPASCMRIFRSNTMAGWLIFLPIIISKSL